ncbi:hypothetical protein L6164_002869 [Bauhinia variegata]|uniref:Uncharacterized protein n=1 Tax=Bauhinia variegata TaxID=167791 RepID=A0ACB9PZM3_BAUVA|nr:hypothetical protein L6164_002869 [Bauhinia variegata]
MDQQNNPLVLESAPQNFSKSFLETYDNRGSSAFSQKRNEFDLKYSVSDTRTLVRQDLGTAMVGSLAIPSQISSSFEIFQDIIIQLARKYESSEVQGLPEVWKSLIHKISIQQRSMISEEGSELIPLEISGHENQGEQHSANIADSILSNVIQRTQGEMVSSSEMNMKRSTHHVEVNLSDTKGYEKHVLVDLFRETYENFLDNSAPCVPENCQEKLSKESLLYIKWLLERYKAVGCNKVFFCCSGESKLQPVKALCTTIKLKPPTCEEIVKVLEFIGHKEGIELPHNLAVKIVEKAKNNLRQAIRSFEATCQNKLPLEEDQLILTGWENEISNIAKNTIDEQSPRQ